MLTLIGNAMMYTIKRLLLVFFVCLSGCVSEEEEEFFAASAFGHLENLQELMPVVRNPNFHSIKGYTPLGAAAYNGKLEIVKFLIVNGADVNFLDQGGRGVGPLYNASRNGHTEIMIYLLERGAILSEKEKGRLLSIGALEDHAEIRPVLKNFGIEIDD